MSKLHQVHCLLATLVAWQMLLALPGYAAPANQKLIFKHVWTAPNTEISNPQFSSDASAITFTRKPHSLDGDEAECYEDGAAKDGPSKSARKNKDDPRWEDPEVVCLSLPDRQNLRAGTIERVDYGWNPIFSNDNQTIFYAHQVKPISGFRVLAATQKGNNICSFNRRTKAITILAKPVAGHLDKPVLSQNGQMLAYSICDAVNGAWPGTVGVGLIELSTGKASMPLKPAKHHKLFDLITSICWCNNQLIAVRGTPQTEGCYLADSYSVDVVNATINGARQIYKSKHPGPGSIFEVTPNQNKTITIKDEKKIVVVEPSSGRITAKAPLLRKDAAGEYSPGRTWCLKKSEEYLLLVDTKQKKTIFRFSNLSLPDALGCVEPQFVWSPDDTMLAMVADKAKTVNQSLVFDCSVLYILDLRSMISTASQAKGSSDRSKPPVH